MKSILRTAAAGVALASFGFASAASAQTTATANAEATILAPLSITVDVTANTLNFGTIAVGNIGAPGSTATVALAATGGAVAGCDGVNLICAGTTTVPTFNIAGYETSVVNVTFDSATVTLTGPGTPLTVGSFTTTLASNQATLVGGAASFQVGGSLTVNAGQAAGTYTGTFPVSVAYD